MIISSEHALKSVLRDDLDGGAPQHYIVDRAAEYVPKNILGTIMMLGCEIYYCEPAPLNQKPYIESFFRVLPKELEALMIRSTF